MAKSNFRILAIRCFAPSVVRVGEKHYVRRMQKSLYDLHESWIPFFQGIHFDDERNTIMLPTNLFEDNILYDTPTLSVSVSAIVGVNGSGKSSILEMLVRILNNASAALMGEKNIYAAAEHLHYIEHVFGEILFVQDKDLRVLRIDGTKVSVTTYKYTKSEINTEGSFSKYKKGVTDVWLDNENVHETLLSVKTKRLKEIEGLFYTVVFNYALYSYNYADFWEEATNAHKLMKLSPKPDLKYDPQLSVWLTGLFHKNDGYQTPIVLNPMRNNGSINAPKENQLAQERILSMLFYEEKGKKGCERYPFRIINQNRIITALSAYPNAIEKDKWQADWFVKKGYFKKRSRLYKNFDFINKEIRDYYKEWCGIEPKGHTQEIAMRYLVYKTLKIGFNYKRYKKLIDNFKSSTYDHYKTDDYLDELTKDTTHVTVKFRRVLTYFWYELYREGVVERDVYYLSYIKERAENYVKEHNKYNVWFKATVADFLPPPFYRVEFQIVKREVYNDENNYSGADVIPFWGLSSGERQIAYTVSNLIYHLYNLNSVWESKEQNPRSFPLLKYKYINVVFDEIELYFHPDLQRRFVAYIISALRNVTLEHIEGVNIMMVTHSPFILSDIPRSNVLALGETNDVHETFCANIHDMLGQSFFMQYSIGQIAQEQIEEIFQVFSQFEKSKNKRMFFVRNISQSVWERYNYVASKVSDGYLAEVVNGMLAQMSEYKPAFGLGPVGIAKRLAELEEEKKMLEGLKGGQNDD